MKAGNISSKPEPLIVNALTPSGSKSLNPPVWIVTLHRPLSASCPAATEDDKSGSKSTSSHTTEPVVKLPLDKAAAAVCAAESVSLIEYPNLPAPYKPPLASTFEPDVLP